MSFSRLLIHSYTFRSTRPLVFARLASTRPKIPQPSKIQFRPKESGYINYERYWSRDPRFTAQIPGDTPTRAILGRLSHAYEVYPFIFIAIIWFGSVIVIGWWSWWKAEVHADKRATPMSWKHLRDDYYKRNTVLFDWDGRTHRRLPIMEKLQDEMLEASEKRSKAKTGSS